MLGLKDQFTEHGDPAKLMALEGLDAAGIEASILARFNAWVSKPISASKPADAPSGLKLVS
jgi:1-deoxy-D-xylulose-5-phosphate synthase